MRVRLRLAWIAAMAWLLLCPADAAAAVGRFEASTLALTGPAPVEGEAFRYLLTLVNAGDEASATVDIALPAAALFAAVDGLPGAAFDASERTVHWEGDVLPGTTRRVTLVLLAGLTAGGQTASLRVTVRPWHGEPTYLAATAEVDTRPAPSLATAGGIGITAAGAVVLGWLVASAFLYLALRVVRPAAAPWAPFAIVLPLAFLTYFGWLAREDARIARLPTVACSVLDRQLDARTASSSTRPGARPTRVYKPWLALGYEAGGERRLAQGFGTDSALSRGSSRAADAAMARYAVGADVPCAIDDRDPRRAYVERGAGGAYVFALIPMPLLGLGVWGLVRGERRRR